MKAVFFEKLGGADVLQYGEFPQPKAQSGETLVRVKACGVNHLDIWLRHRTNTPLPHIPGSDVAGVVEKINGQGEFHVGDEVVINPAIPCGRCARCQKGQPCELVRIFGAATHGGYAEYVVVPITQLHPKPKNLSFTEAAAFPLTFLTAWHMLVSRAQLVRGESVFIWGASGGLGMAAIQIAQHLGGRIIAAAKSQDMAKKIRKHGVDDVIVYTEEDVVGRVNSLTSGYGVDVVFESIGQKTWNQSLAMLRPYGRAVIAGTTSGNEATMDLSDLYVRQLSIFGARMGTKSEFEDVLKLVGERKLQPKVDSVFSLSDTAKAQERMEKGEHVGKIVLEI
ncbi:MAG: zinc-binding dehydrogenase [Candidatus Kerfeldbacteria bacterium]|nr:zinc-binding dehydrogenase [Candidatus Kerfeldbacteria bacterium]